MKELLKKTLYRLTPSIVKQFYIHPVVEKLKKQEAERLEFAQLSYAQEGEDILLNRFFDFKTTGFYVDVGAHHPKRFSNTYFFYKMGWSGINIDAMPGSMAPFAAQRERDINLEMGVGEQASSMDFYIFEEPALNTFNAERADYLIKKGCRLVEKRAVPVETLGAILDKYAPNKEIDFLTIDVEAMEIYILRSMDWTRYRPGFVLLEDYTFDVEHLLENETYQFMVGKGYEFFGKAVNTVIYKRKN
jgi:FkbM family methyltransferase